MKQEMIFDKLLESSASTFVQAGQAYFTLKSVKSGSRVTYKVFQKTEKEYNPDTGKDVKKPIDLYFVSVLTGPCNNDWTNYTYIGIIQDGKFRTTAKTGMSLDDRRLKGFIWFWTHIDNLPDIVEVYWATVCGKCAKLLTVDTSITCGYGRDCAEQLGIPYC